MRNPGLLAFGVTTAILVPASLQLVTAGAKEVGRLVAPDTQYLEIDGQRIDVSVDRTILDAGEKVHVKLHGAIAKGKRVTTELLVFEAIGSGDTRVDTPPRTLERASVTLVGGEGDKEVAFTLPGNRDRSMGYLPAYGDYQIFVVPPKVADRLEQLTKRARRAPDSELSSEWSKEYYRIQNQRSAEDGDVGEPKSAARLAVQTRPQDGPIAIHFPKTLEVGTTATIRLAVSNPTGQKLSTTVSLATPDMLHGTYLGIPDDQVELEDSEIAVDLAPHATKEVTFEIAAKQAGTLGLYARVHCDGSEENDWKACNRLQDGQLEAVEVVDAKAVAAK